jgi:HAD superfamily phosphatase (TIGR01668 family)
MAVADVPIDQLVDRGIAGVLIDMDDTLLPSHADALDPRSQRWFDRLRDRGIGAVILSNGEVRRTRAIGAQLGVVALPLAGKPFRIAFRRGLEHLGTEPAATAMIGDQLFTDVLGANLAGITSILVRPLSAGGLPHTRWARKLERRILARHEQEERGSRGRTIHR